MKGFSGVVHAGGVPVVVLLYEVVAGAEGDEVGVVGGRGDGDGARAADVGVAELVGQLL